MIVARDVAGSAGPRTHFPQRLFHRRQHRRMLPHAKVIVGAPDGDLGPDPMIEGARKATATPLEIGKDAVAPFRAQRVEALTEEGFVVHRRHAQQSSASKRGRNINGMRQFCEREVPRPARGFSADSMYTSRLECRPQSSIESIVARPAICPCFRWGEGSSPPTVLNCGTDNQQIAILAQYLYEHRHPERV